MENVKNHYKCLLLDYQEASRVFVETGRTNLLAYALERLEQFERKFIEVYSLEELLELQLELFPDGTLTTSEVI
jgi:hypothetical protein